MNQIKSIALISDHASPLCCLGGVDAGGQNVYVSNLAVQIAATGYKVDIYTRRDNESLPEVVYWRPGVRVIHIIAGPVAFIPKEALLPFMQTFKDNMLAFIQRNRLSYAVIHANFFMSALVASQLKAVLQIPFVVTFHALGHIRRLYQKDQDKFPLERLHIEENMVKEADHIIAECPQDKEDLMLYYQGLPEKITVIPCGFDPAEFYPVDRAVARCHLQLNLTERVILQLGRIVPRKGIDNVIKALALLKGPAIKLIVVGGASEQPNDPGEPEIVRLQTIAKEAGVADSVLFAGAKKRRLLKYYYSAADIFVTTPWYEPFGITPLEAMACGTPVIGSDVGGIKYTVMHGKTGALVPSNNPQALADSIDKLLNSPGLLTEMGKRAIKRVNALFTWKRVAGSMMRVYQLVAAQNALHNDYTGPMPLLKTGII
jgi:D-inositol-3-phosphate glycosyltransferase